MDEVKVIGQQPCWIAWSNTDTTEGRGDRVPIAASFSYAAIRRVGSGRSVQGATDITEEMVIRGQANYRRDWYAPVRMIEPTKEEKEFDERRLKRLAAIDRAKELGLSDADILALMEGKS